MHCCHDLCTFLLTYYSFAESHIIQVVVETGQHCIGPANGDSRL